MAEGFAAIPTWMIRDERVTARAILVYAALASRAGLRANIPSQETLGREARCTGKPLRAALRELEELGVVERVRRTTKLGYRQADGYRLMSRPLDEDETLTGDAPEWGEANRESEPAPNGNQGDSFLSIEVDSSEVDTCANAHAQSAHSFDEWWNAYPLKKDKGRARTAYKTALKKVSHETLLAAALTYRDDPNRVHAYTKYPASWLNAEAWENGPLPQRAGAAGGTAVERMAARYMQAQPGTEDGGQRAIGA
ncbi:hypothetical protein ACFWHR_04025 [Leucobacter sp. NPDC058333]|uniref:hypothetical protein n=1 Tax=Leucobacter sp. NPDC058333 TaxID=3346450 RepID=UPI00364FE9CB